MVLIVPSRSAQSCHRCIPTAASESAPENETDPRGVPAAGPDRRRAGFDPRRDHQPDTGRSTWVQGARSCWPPTASARDHETVHRKVIVWLPRARCNRAASLIIGANFRYAPWPRSRAALRAAFAFFVAYGSFLYAMFGLFVLVLDLVTQRRSDASCARNGQGDVDGVYHPDRLAIVEPRGDLFGGEHYIQQFLRSFDNECTVFLMVMLVLFVLGFVLDFLEIIYIVIPIVGPVIYGGTFDPKWVTIMIAVNLQTSFLTPPFGFALFYLRGVAPKEVTTGHIYRGVMPFIGIQVAGLMLLAFFPGVVTIIPNLLN